MHYNIQKIHCHGNLYLGCGGVFSSISECGAEDNGHFSGWL